MKKIAIVLLSLLMVIGLVACSENSNQNESTTIGSISSSESTVLSESTASSENTDPDEITNSDPSAPDNSENENSTTPQEQKFLVAYFSATGTTKGVAERMANGLSCDLYEITPEVPYTDADLNYNDNNSRSTVEMNDPSARPAISGSVENMEQYDVVFIGYPIWWGEAPRIVSTFMESYDFSGKTIVPFCTSGGSGIGSSASNLEKLTSNAEWLEGRRLNGSDSQDEVMEWVNSLGLDK